MGWIVRASGARALWVRGGAERPLVTHFQERIPDLVARQIAARVDALAYGTGDRDGVEQMADGTLVVAAKPPAAAALLLPPGTASGPALIDLHHLLRTLQAYPVLSSVTRQQEQPGESVESIAVRLAHQIERLFDADVAVSVCRRNGVEILGASLRSDQRMIGSHVPPGTAMDQVARGEVPGPVVSYDPLGPVPGDRRQRPRRAYVHSFTAWEHVLGAVAFWPAVGEPSAAALAELDSVLTRAAPRIASALEALEHRQQATHDPLTGLRNRRGFDQSTGDAAIQSAVLIVADLDRFKLLNDSLGHAAGDAALVHFATLLAHHVRGRDVSARLGGEEFGIWLPEATLHRGLTVAERVRTALAGSAWHWQGRPWPLTASFGVAGWPESTRHRENLLGLADRAMYAAKEGGRDRVMRAP